uniref:Peroxisomal membrane protein MPV17 n=1 Tax=Araucaria cunninghamii TaxID=56994 RepID=A0A0D6R9K5_ARACU
MRAIQYLGNNIVSKLRAADVLPVKFEEKMTNAMAIRYSCSSQNCFGRPTLRPLLGIPKLNQKLFGWCSRSWGDESKGGLFSQHLEWRTNGWRDQMRGTEGAPFTHQVRAVEGGGYGGKDGPPGGGAGGGGGDGRNSDDDGHGQGTKSFLSWYLMLLEKFPVTTKAVTSALLTFFGDLFCQFVIEESSKLDAKRIFMFSLLGLVLVGPTLHFWYLSLSKLISGPGAIRASLRLLLDQFLFAPIFIGVFFSSLLTLEGRPAEIPSKLEQEWFASVVANWKLWIPFQFLNFLVVPQQFQVLAANIIALAWNIYLSFASHKKIPSKTGS